MCARLREIALDCGKLRSLCGLFFLNQRQAVKTQEVLVWQISARDGKMRSICPKHIRTRKQPEINARLKIKVYCIFFFGLDFANFYLSENIQWGYFILGKNVWSIGGWLPLLGRSSLYPLSHWYLLEYLLSIGVFIHIYPLSPNASTTKSEEKGWCHHHQPRWPYLPRRHHRARVGHPGHRGMWWCHRQGEERPGDQRWMVAPLKNHGDGWYRLYVMIFTNGWWYIMGLVNINDEFWWFSTYH